MESEIMYAPPMVAVADTKQKTLADLLGAAGVTQPQLAAHLDALDTATRVQQIRALNKAEQKRLWEACADAPAFTVEQLVAGVAPGTPVIWAGKNSLPMFTIFEKRFAKVGADVIGYNHQSSSWATGPGYFSAIPSPENAREVRIDYTKEPAATTNVPAGWPKIKPNKAGLSRLVYFNLYDYLRYVSKDVCIGFATRLGKPMDSYFVLART
jgi:hypothetical protein